ncbi:MAG: alpha/beta hydrolase, partial [Armatimonadetes bacterium]|nr:alpha/beta hydrolase [Armatimonadota bacterium]
MSQRSFRSRIRPAQVGRRAALLLLVGMAAAVGSRAALSQTKGAGGVGARFRAMLERPRVALEPRVESAQEGGFVVERGSFRSEARERVPFLLMKPGSARDRLATVIVLHGTGGNKERMAETLRDLAERGFLAIATDGRYFGERAGGADGSDAYQEAILRAWKEPDPKKQEHPFFYDTAFDVWRLLDYLESRPDVDGRR